MLPCNPLVTITCQAAPSLTTTSSKARIVYIPDIVAAVTVAKWHRATAVTTPATIKMTRAEKDTIYVEHL